MAKTRSWHQSDQIRLDYKGTVIRRVYGGLDKTSVPFMDSGAFRQIVVK